ncbi:MAG: hypothetical protein HY040_23970 [Planctomycetes bacterium]|nr:hypothetical protein [Planctomycetota bacterium]
MTEGPRAEVTDSSPGGGGAVRGIIIAAVVILVPIALVLTLAYALPKIGQSKDDAKPSPPKGEADPALLVMVRSKHAEAAAKFSELEAAYQKLDNQFKDAFGVTLEMAGDTKKLPLDLVECMTAKDAPLQAWTDLRNASVPELQFNERRDILRTGEGKIRDLNISLTDKNDLEDVAAWAVARLSDIRGQGENINVIRDTLRAYRRKETP